MRDQTSEAERYAALVSAKKSQIMKYFPTLLLIAGLFSPISAPAHTTVLIPQLNKNGQKIIKILHFHPAAGAGLMGIRLGVEDTRHLKGLEAVFLIHEKKAKDLNTAILPDYYTVRGKKRETYTLPVNKQSGFFKPGDYIIVVRHKAHWKKSEGLYRQKVAKLYLNYFGVLTDWPDRVLKNMPEIVPLVQPYNVYAGSIFRAEAVNDKGERSPHARINIEYLNYALNDTELETTAAGRIKDEIADSIVFTDGNGSFSFVPPQKGLWTFTLVDGDNNKFINGKKLEYDSSLSILVK
jgi:cobalt/nickel transport protein